MFLTESDFQFGKLCQNTSRKPIDVNTADVINYDLHCFFFGWGWWLDFESIDVNSKQIFQLYGALFFGNSDVIRTLRIFLGDSSVDFLSPFGKNGLVKRCNRFFFSLSGGSNGTGPLFIDISQSMIVGFTINWIKLWRGEFVRRDSRRI